MNKLMVLITTCGFMLLAGCAHNNVVADSTTRSGSFYGDMGITGDFNVVTVEKHSRLTKLSILGHGNEVIIEEGVRLPAIEVFGSDNVISVPDYMLVQMNQVGSRNQLIRRPASDPEITTRTYRIRERGGEVDVTVEESTTRVAEPTMIVEEADEPLEPVQTTQPSEPRLKGTTGDELPPLKGTSGDAPPLKGESAGQDVNPIK